MPEDLKQPKVISKKNTGFPEYLDFDTLRREGIGYLGKLSGKLWTDHNVHDPGITILEMLCYALLDLGYRTNLPAADIFTKNPNDPSEESNFFTPVQILTNNPLTITDFRKLLIDIPGVKNAWLEIAKDYDAEKFCNPNNYITDPCSDKYLNGLYHVYIDAEIDIEKVYAADSNKKEEFTRALEKKIADALLGHRNFCEDFIDITILCKLELGVCADIELEADADTTQVYLEIAETLYHFFSPAPSFYTLPQLLDKGKTMDEIFAGRPIGITESHGFVDTQALEQLQLRKAIHLSDVYNVLLAIKGVRRVQHLQLKRCDDNKLLGSWTFPIPENHVIEFSIDCSGFQFSRHGVPVLFDATQFQMRAKIATQQNGKILYKNRFLVLDYQTPVGIYRDDLDQYYSIQNEFPRVYGIAEGGLPDNVEPSRKAKALQLKGYLLFFDQMLASYLSQLKNIRSLFAFKTIGDTNESHTYFVNNDLESVPDLQKLLRLSAGEKNGGQVLQQSILARPVDKAAFINLIETAQIKNTAIENINTYQFKNTDAASIAVAQLMDDIYNNNYEYGIVEKNDECVFYYLLSSSDCFALISNVYYSSYIAAKLAVESLTYVAGFSENYSTWFDSQNNYAAFNIEFNLADYSKYLQLIVEHKVLYQQRRQSFLNHLLSRFAEQFTDYTMLSYSNYSQIETTENEIKAKENFLSLYPDLSANRGKAYNYKLNGWNNDNISGFEKRFKAYSGIQNLKRNSLCNFEVIKYQNKYNYQLSFAGQVMFVIPEIFNSKIDARNAVHALLQQLKNPSAYEITDNKEGGSYRIFLNYQQKQPAVFTAKFNTRPEAETIKNNLLYFFSGEIAKENIFINSYLYNARLIDSKGEVVKIFNDSPDNAVAAKTTALKNITKINTGQLWKDAGEKKSVIGKLIFDNTKEEIFLVDSGNFKVISNTAIVGSPDKYTYQLLDRNNSFKFFSVNEFKDEKSAKQDSENLLLLLTIEKNYTIQKDTDTDKYKIAIKEDETIFAIAETNFESEQAANTAKAIILDIVTKSTYRLAIYQFPDTWKFNYLLGYNTEAQPVFESDSSFKSADDAEKAAKQFTASIGEMVLHETDGSVALSPNKNKRNSIAVTLKNDTKVKTVKKSQLHQMENLLAMQKEAMALLQQDNTEVLDKFIEIDAASRSGLFVYRLVDKDNVYAFYQTDIVEKENLEKQLTADLSFDITLYNYLDLFLKGDIINKRKDENSNSYWYHYQVKSANSINKPASTESKALVLFESTKGYESSEEAVLAFQKNYLNILKIGSSIDNYGISKLLSKTAILIHSNDPCIKSESIAFVPKETLDYFGDETTSIPELIKVVKSYPVKKIFTKADCKQFHTRFQSCEEGDCIIEEKGDCANTIKEIPFYYFSLYNKQQDREEWQSVKYYETPAAAWKEFQFFVLLLQYHGNYFIDCGCKSIWNEELKKFDPVPAYKIFIREVLAESAERFMTEEYAWGQKGIQKFIDVSQSENSFHNYLEKNCCNSFYVACYNKGLYHPCKYNIPEQRDNAIRLLFKSLQNIKNWKWDGCNQKITDQFILKDFDGNNVAEVKFNNPSELFTSSTYFDLYADILNRIALYGLCIENEQLYLRGKSISFISVYPVVTADQLKEKLLWLSAYFPFMVVRSDSTVKYCMEIKIPEINMDDTDDCGKEENGICYIAWKSDCCYNNCTELLNAWQIGLFLLSDINNYKPVYDCECHSYSIALHYVNSLSVTDNNNQCGYFINQQQRVVLPCENAIVAYNPQCYPDAKVTCEAVSRAKALINAEGLHVAEHILMRPHCVEECVCRLPVKPNEFANCKFPNWENVTDDPCEKSEKPASFIPGYDPYSFIATVVLPAWPLKFRNKENRLLLENILYREAPAHILLRILWLAPHDFCCFEKMYKEWQAWLGKKKRCTDFTVCDLMDFLFNRPYELLKEPESCKPCDEQLQVQDACKSRGMQVTETKTFLDWQNEINQVFSWINQKSSTYNFISCEEQRTTDAIIETPLIPHAATNLPQPANVIFEKQAGEKIAKAKFIRGRFAQYIKEIDAMAKETRGLQVVEMARRFADNNTPTAAEYKTVAEAVIKAQDDKKNELFTKKRANTLISILTRFFIDKWAFNGKKISSLEKSADVFELLRKNKTTMLDIYRRWESDALKKHEPQIDMNAVKILLTGNK